MGAFISSETSEEMENNEFKIDKAELINEFDLKATRQNTNLTTNEEIKSFKNKSELVNINSRFGNVSDVNVTFNSSRPSILNDMTFEESKIISDVTEIQYLKDKQLSDKSTDSILEIDKEPKQPLNSYIERNQFVFTKDIFTEIDKCKILKQDSSYNTMKKVEDIINFLDDSSSPNEPLKNDLTVILKNNQPVILNNDLPVILKQDQPATLTKMNCFYSKVGLKKPRGQCEMFIENDNLSIGHLKFPGRKCPITGDIYFEIQGGRYYPWEYRTFGKRLDLEKEEFLPGPRRTGLNIPNPGYDFRKLGTFSNYPRFKIENEKLKSVNSLPYGEISLNPDSGSMESCDSTDKVISSNDRQTIKKARDLETN